MYFLNVVTYALADGVRTSGSDTADACVFEVGELPEPLAFDHTRILADYRAGRYEH